MIKVYRLNKCEQEYVKLILHVNIFEIIWHERWMLWKIGQSYAQRKFWLFSQRKKKEKKKDHLIFKANKKNLIGNCTPQIFTTQINSRNAFHSSQTV